jgi:hypothetical protein
VVRELGVIRLASLSAEEKHTLPIGRLDSLDERAEVATGDIPCHIVRKNHELMIGVHDRYLHRSGRLVGGIHPTRTQERVVIGVVACTETDGKSVTVLGHDLESA